MKKTLKKMIPKKVFELAEPKYHLLQAVAASAINGRPAKKMKFIGVTGTNGKTSTCFMIHKILTEAGIKTGLITTVAYGVNDQIIDQTEHVTTMSAPKLQKQLVKFAKEGVEWVVLETTSHALAQSRVFGIDFSIAVITNITHEHLDYHKTFENYANAKAKLLKNTSKNGGTIIVNADDQASVKVSKSLPGKITYGIQNGDVRAENIKQTAELSLYTTKIEGEQLEITCHLPGEFNIYNSLAACLAARSAGVPLSGLPTGINQLKGVQGRVYSVRAGQKFSAVVDFAHTPDSFERLLKTLRDITKGKLIVMFGSAGRRDEAKRAIQGEIAGKYADEVVLTEEDDRDVDGWEILEQIAEGAARFGKIRDENLFLVSDRTDAIKFAVGRVDSASDTVVFLGKGHEKTIERADGAHPWNEVSQVEGAIRQYLFKNDKMKI